MQKGQYNRVPLDALDAIVEHRMNGATVKEACLMEGQNPDTIYTYLTQGKKAKSGRKRDFYLKMEAAKSQFIKIVKDKMLDSGNPRALEFLLRVTDPDTYNITNKQEVSANVQSNVTLSSVFSDETTKNLLNESNEDDGTIEILLELDEENGNAKRNRNDSQ